MCHWNVHFLRRIKNSANICQSDRRYRWEQWRRLSSDDIEHNEPFYIALGRLRRKLAPAVRRIAVELYYEARWIMLRWKRESPQVSLWGALQGDIAWLLQILIIHTQSMWDLSGGRPPVYIYSGSAFYCYAGSASTLNLYRSWHWRLSCLKLFQNVIFGQLILYRIIDRFHEKKKRVS